MLPVHTILHPTDFSERSGTAFQVACALAHDYSARLVVLHVAEPPMVAYGGVMTPPAPPPDYRKAAEEQLRQVRAPKAGLRVEHRLEEGDPATEILRLAEETNCDLIAMSTHGRTGLARLVMGSVAEQVLRKASCPVLTVKPPSSPVSSTTPEGMRGVDSMSAIRAILHPTDYSELSRAAFHLACSLARDLGARLIIQHVVATGTTEFLALADLGSQERTEPIRQTLWKELRHIQVPDGQVLVEHRLDDGDPAAGILRAANETNCDLIVLGTHGRTGLGRLLMGSVAEQVVRRAPCGVLTVKTPFSDAVPAGSAANEEATEGGRA